MIAWTIGGVVFVYVVLLVSRLLQSPTAAAQNQSLGIRARADRGVGRSVAFRREDDESAGAG